MVHCQEMWLSGTDLVQKKRSNDQLEGMTFSFGAVNFGIGSRYSTK
ncbi:MAG: hypothetical protein AB8G15_06530 [Saprospiraceae bacterium]